MAYYNENDPFWQRLSQQTGRDLRDYMSGPGYAPAPQPGDAGYGSYNTPVETSPGSNEWYSPADIASGGAPIQLTPEAVQRRQNEADKHSRQTAALGLALVGGLAAFGAGTGAAATSGSAIGGGTGAEGGFGGIASSGGVGTGGGFGGAIGGTGGGAAGAAAGATGTAAGVAAPISAFGPAGAPSTLSGLGGGGGTALNSGIANAVNSGTAGLSSVGGSSAGASAGGGSDIWGNLKSRLFNMGGGGGTSRPQPYGAHDDQTALIDEQQRTAQMLAEALRNRQQTNSVVPGGPISVSPFGNQRFG